MLDRDCVYVISPTFHCITSKYVCRFHPEAGERVGAIKGDQVRFAELADSVQSLLQELVSLAAFYHGVRRG